MALETISQRGLNAEYQEACKADLKAEEKLSMVTVAKLGCKLLFWSLSRFIVISNQRHWLLSKLLKKSVNVTVTSGTTPTTTPTDRMNSYLLSI